MPLATKRKVHSLRFAQRYPTEIPAVLRQRRELHDVTIANLSTGGAKIRCLAALAIGSTVTLETRHEPIRARVVWRNDRGYGLNFMSEVEPLVIVRRNHPRLRTVFGDDLPSWSEASVFTQPPERRRA